MTHTNNPTPQVTEKNVGDPTDLREKLEEMAISLRSGSTKGRHVTGVFDVPMLVKFFTEELEKREREARIDERKQVALDNYQGQTFSDATNYKGKFDKFIRNNERRIEYLTPKPYKSGIEVQDKEE